MVQLYLSFFSLSKIIVLAKRVRKSTFTSIISPVDDIEAVTEVVSDMLGCLKDLMLRYVPRVRDIPLYQGMSFDPTWKALPTHRLTREVLQKRAKQPKSKVVALRSCFTSFAYELGAWAELVQFTHSRGEQWSQGALWPKFTRFALTYQCWSLSC